MGVMSLAIPSFSFFNLMIHRICCIVKRKIIESLLPLGSYYTKETKNPDGYKLTGEVLTFTPQGDKKVGVHKLEGTVYNTKLPEETPGGHGDDGSGNTPGKLPTVAKDTKTGDVALGALVAAVLLAAAGITVVCVKRKRAGKKKSGSEKEEL